MTKRLIIAIATVGLLVAACGDDDAGSTTSTAGTSATSGTGETTTTASPAGGAATCDGLVTLDEAAALFGEPAVFDVEGSQDIAGVDAITCVWSSVEDPEDLEDLQVHLFQVQVYRGAEYYAPEMVYDDAAPLEGIGEDAFISAQLGVSTGFVDGDRVAFVTYSVIGTGDAPDAMTKRDQVIDLLRLVHDRIA
jgi:hypothetical protein